MSEYSWDCWIWIWILFAQLLVLHCETKMANVPYFGEKNWMELYKMEMKVKNKYWTMSKVVSKGKIAVRYILIKIWLKMAIFALLGPDSSKFWRTFGGTWANLWLKMLLTCAICDSFKIVSIVHFQKQIVRHNNRWLSWSGGWPSWMALHIVTCQNF